MPVITWSPGTGDSPQRSDGFFRDSRESNPVGQALFAFVARDLLRLTVSVNDGERCSDLIKDDAFSPWFSVTGATTSGDQDDTALNRRQRRQRHPI